MENWLSIAVAVYLIGMVLYGHYKGFIKLAVSAVALIITFATIHVAMPQVTDFLKNNTKIYSSFEQSMKDAMKLRMPILRNHPDSVQLSKGWNCRSS